MFRLRHAIRSAGFAVCNIIEETSPIGKGALAGTDRASPYLRRTPVRLHLFRPFIALKIFRRDFISALFLINMDFCVRFEAIFFCIRHNDSFASKFLCKMIIASHCR